MQAILLFGGMSDERLVALASAQNVLSTVPGFTPWFIAPNGAVTEVPAAEVIAHQKPFEVQFAPKGMPFAADIKTAVNNVAGRPVFLCLHGDEGENGTIQKVFEDAGVHYTGSDSKASATCFDKLATKKVVASHRVPVAEQITLSKGDAKAVQAAITDFVDKHQKIVVKPIASGSSVGLHIVDRSSDLPKVAFAVATSGHAYMAEMFLEGREITVGVAQRGAKLEPLCASEVLVQKGRAFDYQGKYLGDGITEVTPAKLDTAETKQCLDLGVAVHQHLGCFGYSRSDMILTAKGPIFLETNTLPGLSKSSFVPQQLAHRGIKLADFIQEQLALALTR
ncbi:MAG: ATP-grasp domain-containing protein [Myxococcota bacterium]